MGFSIEDLSSSEAFDVHKIVQCCCTSKCCTYKVVEKEDDCKTCKKSHDTQSPIEYDR